jgi:hypothetical protein
MALTYWEGWRESNAQASTLIFSKVQVYDFPHPSAATEQLSNHLGKGLKGRVLVTPPHWIIKSPNPLSFLQCSQSLSKLPASPLEVYFDFNRKSFICLLTLGDLFTAPGEMSMLDIAPKEHPAHPLVTPIPWREEGRKLERHKPG